MKNIIRYVLTFILTMALITFLLVNLFSTTILNEQYILSKLQEVDYYNKMYDYVQSCFEKYIGQSGLDEEILNNVVSKEKIKNDTQIIISNIYDGTKEEIDTQEIKENLKQNINNSLNNQKLTSSQQTAIDTFIEEIVKEYSNAMTHTSYENKINQQYVKFMKYLEIAKKAILVILGVSIIILVLVSLKRIYRAISMVGISLLSTGVLFEWVNWYINTKIKIQTITIFNDTISETVRNILQEILGKIQGQGIILLVLGIVLIIIPVMIHYFSKYKLQKISDVEE
ncbi:MAG: hypothetical protein ACLS90_06820 [Clostridia bacterium]